MRRTSIVVVAAVAALALVVVAAVSAVDGRQRDSAPDNRGHGMVSSRTLENEQGSPIGGWHREAGCTASP